MATPNGGKLKFNLKPSPELEEKLYIELEKWRAIFYKMNLVGEYQSSGLGYGSLSRRLQAGQDSFVITGYQTGSMSHLGGRNYTKVIKCDLNKLTVEANGPTAPSGDSINHCAIFSSGHAINAVFYVHHKMLWEFMLTNNYDKVGKGLQSGSKELAEACKQYATNKKQGIFALEEHEGAIISYGQNIEEAGKIILDTLKDSRK